MWCDYLGKGAEDRYR